MITVNVEISDILKKYNTAPKSNVNPYREYSRLKSELFREFGFLPAAEYNLWVKEVCRILDI